MRTNAPETTETTTERTTETTTETTTDAALARRVLILAPTGRDAPLAREVLEGAGLSAAVCADMGALCEGIAAGAAVALIASEALTPDALALLREVLTHQPPWSDLPVVILTSGGREPLGKSRLADALDALGSTTLLERPLRVATLVHAVQAGLGARGRQYEVREHLEEHVRLEEKLQAEYQKQRVFLRDVLASVTGGRLHLCDSPADLPDPLPPVGDPIPLSRTSGMSEMRQVAKGAALAAGLSDDRWQDLITAVSEAAMNAAVHAGGGEGRVRAGGEGTVQVWVRDQGRGINVENLPRAALAKGYTTAGSLGHGMKMMLETVDRLWLLTGLEGTTVVMEQDRLPPPPPWY